jgi:hypothetical protein
MPALLVLALWLAIAPVPARSAPSDDSPDAYRETVAELLRLSGASKIGEQMANSVFRSIVTALQQSNPNLPPRVVEIAREVASETFGQLFADEQKMLDLYARIYQKYFSRAELEEMIAFYRTPTGQKSVQAMPAVMQEASQEGEKMAEGAKARFVEEFQRRLQAEGLMQP